MVKLWDYLMNYWVLVRDSSMKSVRVKYDTIIEPIKKIFRENVHILYECPNDWDKIHTVITDKCNSIITKLLFDNSFCFYIPTQRYNGCLIININGVETETSIYIDRTNPKNIDFRVDSYTLLTLSGKLSIYSKTPDFLQWCESGYLTIEEFGWFNNRCKDRVRRCITESTIYIRNETIMDILE